MSGAIDAFYDLLSATLGAASGAFITGLANRQKNQSLKNKIVIGKKELEKIKLENEKLLKIIAERETKILEKENELSKLRKSSSKNRRN